MISRTPFIVVDLETTGLVPALDRIIEIAAVKVVNGQAVDEWHSLVNPEIFIPDEITNFTGITSEMVENAPPLSEVADVFLNFLGTDSVFVAHNVDFDLGFLNGHMLRLDKPLVSNPSLCTVELARHVHPNLSKYNLGSLSETFGVQLPQAHRAIHDARATAELFVKFMNVLEQGGLRYLKDIPRIQNLPKEEGPGAGQGMLF